MAVYEKQSSDYLIFAMVNLIQEGICNPSPTTNSMGIKSAFNLGLTWFLGD